MGVKVTTEGVNEIIQSLAKLGNKAEQIVDNALIEAIKPIHSEMQKLAPRSRLNKKHMADEIPIKKENTEGTVHSVSAGWGKDDNSKHFYSKYVEWGTSKMSAKPFMQPAIHRKEKQAYEVLINEIEKELEL